MTTFSDVINSGDGVLSLREAIIQANAGPGGDTIILSAGTYTLSLSGTNENNAATGDLDLRKDVTITGTGNSTIIDANGINRVFHVVAGNASISQLVIRGGNAENRDGGGLIVDSGATASLSYVMLTNNIAKDGGAIDNQGVIYLSNVFITNNTASHRGGGLGSGGSVTLSNVTISNNIALSNKGGGIDVQIGTLTATNVTISGNASGDLGGGIQVDGAVTLQNVTITNNSSSMQGSGVNIGVGGGSVSLRNTIIAGNNGATDVSGSFSSVGNNLIGNKGTASGFVNGINGDQVGTSSTPIDAKLGALGFNGGFTPTHALQAGSTAINTGSIIGAPSLDQRGIARSGAVDMGAFESSQEFRVNSTTAGNQVTSASNRGSHQAVATAADKSYVVVWSDDASDGNGWGVYAKRFNADGTTKGTEFQVNSTNAGSEQWAVVASDGSGRFAIAWTAVDANGTGVYMRRFSADGSAIDTSDVLVNWQATANDQQNPSITMNNAGQIVIAWETRNGGAPGIYAKRFDMTSPATSNQVPTPIITVDTGSNRYNPVVDLNENGKFVIVWNNSTHVFSQRYNADGSARGSAIDINVLSTTLEHQAVVAVQDSGDFILAYRSQLIGLEGIYINHYRDAGTAYSLATKVSTGSTHTAPSISMDATGNFIVVYQGDGDGSGQGVFGRKYDASAVARGDQFQINQSTNSNQQQVSVAMKSLGNFVAVWSGNGDRAGQSDASGVFARQYSANDISMISDINNSNNAINEGAVNGTTVGITAQAVDLDPNDTISYSLIDNAGGRFAIHATSGVVTVANGSLLDYETATSHGIMVRAASSDGSVSTKLFSIALMPVNDNIPLITSHGGASLVSLTVAENTTGVTSVSATDADNPSQTLSFSLAGGADQSRFTVNGATGQLSFLASPNFEFPSDSNNDNVYEVIVAVSDGQGGSASQNFMVAITDVNEFQVGSISDTNSAANEVIENVPNGTRVGIKAFAKDNDGSNNTVTYSLADDAGGRFVINATSGTVRVADGALLDREVAAGYDIVVRASSSDGSVSTQNFYIGLIGANDNSPVFTSVDQVSVAENQSFVQVLTATDDDQPTQSISYSIVGGQDASHFVIRASNQLTFVRPPNFENPTDNDQNNIYRVTVAANDENGGSTMQLIEVQVTNVNESPTVVNQKYIASQGQVVQSIGLGVLTGAFDEDGDALSASLQRDVSNGVLVLNSDGSFNYSPNDGFAGLDSFTFAVADGNGGVSVGLVEFLVNLNTVVVPQGANTPSASDRTNSDGSQSPSTSASSTSNTKAAKDAGTTPAPQTLPTITVTQNNDSSQSTASKDEPTSESLLAAKDSEKDDKSFSDRFSLVASAVSEREFHSMQRMAHGLYIQSNVTATMQQNNETLGTMDIMVAQDLVWADLDRLREQMQVATESQPLVLGTAAGVASSLSVGYVMWLLRGGYVVAGLMAQLPAWRLIDPLPILSQLEAMGDDDDDDSLQTMVDRSNDLHDKNTLKDIDELASQDEPSFVEAEMPKSLRS